MKIKIIFILFLLIIYSYHINADETFDTSINTKTKKFQILFTGETHGMIYPCDCPTSPAGGVSRRRTLIEKIKENNTAFLFDAGGLFAGSQFDIYTQGEEKDKIRTLVAIQAMQIMKYDAVAIGDDEFIWGIDFLQNNLINKLPTLSCNLFNSSEKYLASEYKIIERNGIKLGVIGVTTPELLLLHPDLTGKIKVEDPIKSVIQTIKKIRSEVDYIVILSHLGEDLNIKLAEQSTDIDLIINAHRKTSVGNFAEIGSSLLVQFDFEGKSLGKVNVIKKPGQKPSSIFNEITITSKIEEDIDIKNLLDEYKKNLNPFKTKIKLELFVMSLCLYGNDAEKEICNLFKESGDYIDFDIHFILDKQDDDFISLHGEEEIEENIRQLIIKNNFPSKFWEYLNCRNTNLQDSPNKCLNSLEINSNELNLLIKKNKDALLNAEVLLAKRLKVNTSPTLFINNKIYSGEIKKDKIIRVICEYLPKSVSEQLSLCLNLPECFSDEDCALPEMIGKCLNPGTGESKCVYIKDTEVTLSILYSSTMINPDYYKVLDSIAPLFPNLKVIFTSIESDEGLKLKEKNKIKSIPVFIFDSTILRAQNYLSISSHLEKIENNYILNTSKYKNTELFFHETKINNQIDIFISPLAYQSYIVIDSIRKTLKLKGMYNLGIKYISQKDAKDNVFFRFGLTELEEAERQIAIQIYHPEKFFDYIKARSLNLNSSYWEDPITMLGLNPQEIKLQSKNETIISILKKNAEKTKNFRINSEVSVVINNQERIPLLNQNDLQILLKKLIKLFNAE